MLKQPVRYFNFQQFSGGACSRTPLEHFFILNMLQSLPEKNELENMANLGAPSLKKFLDNVADKKTFSKGCLRSFSGLTSLYLIYTQPNSKGRVSSSNGFCPYQKKKKAQMWVRTNRNALVKKQKSCYNLIKGFRTMVLSCYWIWCNVTLLFETSSQTFFCGNFYEQISKLLDKLSLKLSP